MVSSGAGEAFKGVNLAMDKVTKLREDSEDEEESDSADDEQSENGDNGDDDQDPAKNDGPAHRRQKKTPEWFDDRIINNALKTLTHAWQATQDSHLNVETVGFKPRI